MDQQPPSEPQFDAAFLRSMVLLTTLTAASRVWHKIGERRSGLDPSGQEEAAVVRPYLEQEQGEIAALTRQLERSLVIARHHHEARLPGLVRRFDSLMTLSRLGARLHGVHQRLLSLYPDVSEALVEEARALQGQTAVLQEIEATVFLDHLATFVERAMDFTAWLRQELAAAS